MFLLHTFKNKQKKKRLKLDFNPGTKNLWEGLKWESRERLGCTLVDLFLTATKTQAVLVSSTDISVAQKIIYDEVSQVPYVFNIGSQWTKGVLLI